MNNGSTAAELLNVRCTTAANAEWESRALRDVLTQLIASYDCNYFLNRMTFFLSVSSGCKRKKENEMSFV